MAGRKQVFDNTELKGILKGYSYLNQFTPEGIKILQEAIDEEFAGTTSKFGGKRKEVLNLVLKLSDIDYTTVDILINVKRKLKGEPTIKKSMLYNYRNIAIRASTKLLEAYNHGVMITHQLKGKSRTLSGQEKMKLRNMINNNATLEAIQTFINGLWTSFQLLGDKIAVMER